MNEEGSFFKYYLHKNEMELYLFDSYLKEWETEIIEVEGKFVVLKETAFYPGGGGQPNDEGKILRGEEEFKVVTVMKKEGKIIHEVDREGLSVGEKVKCFLDWKKRYKMMRMHTAAHIISGIIEKEANALISGNQLGTEKSRIDFNLENFDREKMREYIEKANEIVKKALPIKIYFLSYDEAIKQKDLFKLLKGFDKKIEKVRIVEIEGFQKQADGGTHVANTKEVGKILFLDAENKGKDRRRIYFTLENNDND